MLRIAQVLREKWLENDGFCSFTNKKQTCEWSCQRFCPNLNGSRTFSLTAIPLKLGLIQTLSRLCSLRPDFGRNADWLLEQYHKIWLAVGNAGSWKRLFLAWLFSWMIRRRRREGSILLSFLLFYGLMVGKYALICAMEIQKIHMVVHIFSGFALFTESECIAELNPSASCWPLTRCNKREKIKILSILKVVSFESLAGNDFSERGTQAEAHCERNLNRQQ